MSWFDGAKTRVWVGYVYSEEFEVKLGVVTNLLSMKICPQVPERNSRVFTPSPQLLSKKNFFIVENSVK